MWAREGNGGVEVEGGMPGWVVGFRLGIGGLGVCCVLRRFGGRGLSELSWPKAVSVVLDFDCDISVSDASF